MISLAKCMEIFLRNGIDLNDAEAEQAMKFLYLIAEIQCEKIIAEKMCEKSIPDSLILSSKKKKL